MARYGVNIVGSLTDNNGVLSNFSETNYATFPETFNFQNYNWELNLKFTTGNDVTNEQTVISTITNSFFGFNLIVRSSTIVVGISPTNNSSFSIPYNNAIVIQPNITYYLKLQYLNTSGYEEYISTDGETYTLTGSSDNTSSLINTNMAPYIGKHPNQNLPFFGSIDLNESYIKVNGATWWVGIHKYNGTRIQLRHDITANWNEFNPILLEGEVGLELDTRKQKVGDGVTAWNSLPYDTGSTALQSITSTNVTNALGYTPVNKSGDTMTGNLVISTDNTYNVNIALKNTNQTLSSIPSNNTFTNLAFTDNNNDTLGRVFLRDTTTGREMCLRVDSYNGNSTAFIAGFNTSNVAYCTFPNTTCCDGQWVNLGSGNIISGSNITWTTGHNYDLSSYLPNDGKIYEVIFQASWTGSTTGLNHTLRVSTDVIASPWNWLGRAFGTDVAAGTCILPVGTGRYVKLTTEAKGCNAVYFSALGYRRLGTNS